MSYNSAISIHALREEGDGSTGRSLWARTRFLSTPSARRATRQAPHSEHGMDDFYPRPPRGGRRIYYGLEIPDLKFLSTPSARRATYHAVEGNKPEEYFYPRPPRGGRLRKKAKANSIEVISIHALREEGDYHIFGICQEFFYFYPRPPRGGRPWIRLIA